jgi:hypothetical protein
MQQQKLPFTNLIQKCSTKEPKKKISRVLEKKKVPKISKTYPQEMIGERKFSHYETGDSGVQIQVRKKERTNERKRERERQRVCVVSTNRN